MAQNQHLLDALRHIEAADAALQARISESFANKEPAGHEIRNTLNVAKAWLGNCTREINKELREA